MWLYALINIFDRFVAVVCRTRSQGASYWYCRRPTNPLAVVVAGRIWVALIREVAVELLIELLLCVGDRSDVLRAFHERYVAQSTAAGSATNLAILTASEREKPD